MKLTITIPKDKYRYIQELEQGNTDYATTRMLYHAVKHGKPTRWIPVSEKLPEDGIYLVTVERTPGKPIIETKSFAKDLNRVDDYDFPEHKCGWYEYDSEYGYWEDTDVIAWQSLQQPYKAVGEVGESE